MERCVAWGRSCCPKAATKDLGVMRINLKQIQQTSNQLIQNQEFNEI